MKSSSAVANGARTVARPGPARRASICVVICASKMSRSVRPLVDSSSTPASVIALDERGPHRVDAALAVTGDEHVRGVDVGARPQVRERGAHLVDVDVDRLARRASSCSRRRRALSNRTHDRAVRRERLGEQLAAAVLRRDQRAVPVAIGRDRCPRTTRSPGTCRRCPAARACPARSIAEVTRSPRPASAGAPPDRSRSWSASTGGFVDRRRRRSAARDERERDRRASSRCRAATGGRPRAPRPA